MELLHMGIVPIDVPLTAVRISAGLFFAISGYNKLFDEGRHARLKKTLIDDHIPWVAVMQWWVPGWEVLAGVMLAVGLLTPFAAFVLSIICVIACSCESKAKVESYHPINAADRVDDWLYLPEILYLCILSLSLFGGGGDYSLDAIIFY